jgi:hypothetical protein
MTLIPGWDSVTGAHWWSNFFFWASILALVMLGITEIVSHRYTERKDELADIEQDRTKRRHDEEIARLHLETATASERAATLEKEAAAARLEQERLKALVAWRTIPMPARNQLASALADAGGSVALVYVQNDPEAVYLAAEISNVFAAANRPDRKNKWQVVGVPRMYSDRVVFGIHIPDRGNKQSKLIQQAFSDCRIEYFRDDVPDTGMVIGAISQGPRPLTTDAVIIVGSKQPPF